jgi:uncharacterized membrane protein YgaE (UPF0421/DUF939 family)
MGTEATENRSMEWLRRLGVGERVLKTALAAGLAWQLGQLLLGIPNPYLAPLAAVLVMQITIAESVTAAGQRLFGVIVGVIIALAFSSRLGVSAGSIALLVLVALAVGTRLRLGPQGVSQVAVSALLVMVVAVEPRVGFALDRVAETIVGAIVGLAVNALLAPPSHLPAVRTATRALADELAAVLDQLAAAVASGLAAATAAALERARAAAPLVAAADAARERAETSQRFNLFGRRERATLDRYVARIRSLDRAAIQVRGIARTLSDASGTAPAAPAWLAPTALGSALAAAIHATSDVVRRSSDALSTSALPQSTADLESAAAAADRMRRAVVDVAASSHAMQPVDWLPLGAVLTDLGRIVADLAPVHSPADEPGRSVR